MSAVREHHTNIVGVDTHACTNTYAILVAATGQVTDTATFPTIGPGAGLQTGEPLHAHAWVIAQYR